MKKEDFYKEAAKKVKAKKGFLYHFIAYAFTIGLLYIIINSKNNGDILPVIIVGLSWGIGLAAHYLSTFGTEHLDFLGLNPDWEEEELEKELERLKRKNELQKRINQEQITLDDSEILELKEVEKRRLEDDH
jgi:hypothetical protein